MKDNYGFTIEDIHKCKNLNLTRIMDRDYFVIEQRFNGVTLKRIGEIIKVTPERVRQIEARVSEKIRDLIKDK